MKIRLKGNIFGAWKGKKGAEVDRPEKEAKSLIKGGFAVVVKPPTPETQEKKSWQP